MKKLIITEAALKNMPRYDLRNTDHGPMMLDTTDTDFEGEYIKVKDLEDMLEEVEILHIRGNSMDPDEEQTSNADSGNEKSENASEEETLHIRLTGLKLRPKEEKTFNGILTLRDVPVRDTPGADYNANVLFLHNASEPLANLANEFSQGEPITMYYHITTERTEETERLLREISGEVDARVESELAYPGDDHWIHYNRFKIGGQDLNYILKHSLGKWILIKLVKY